MVGPIGEGTLKPASRINSKENSISKSSKIMGNGTFSLEAIIENNSSVGINSWWKFIIAIHTAGRSNVIKIDIPRITFKKFAKVGFKFVSSGEAIKSM